MRKLLIGILVTLALAGCGMEVAPVEEPTLLPAETTAVAIESTTAATEAAELCIRCNTNPSGGYGPSGMECADCYYGNDAILEGAYVAEFENVQITLTHHDYVDYILTYTDLTAGIILERIPMAYYNTNTPTEISMMFITEDSYPEHSGYVEIYWSEGSVFPYSYNALIDGLADTGGDYAPLNKVG